MRRGELLGLRGGIPVSERLVFVYLFENNKHFSSSHKHFSRPSIWLVVEKHATDAEPCWRSDVCNRNKGNENTVDRIELFRHEQNKLIENIVV